MIDFMQQVWSEMLKETLGDLILHYVVFYVVVIGIAAMNVEEIGGGVPILMKIIGLPCILVYIVASTIVFFLHSVFAGVIAVFFTILLFLLFIKMAKQAF